MKIMVLDGNSLVNRAYYGVRMLNAPDGTPTNAVYGFLNILRRLMTEESPDAVCVTFDLPEQTFRRKQYEGYKAQRKGMPEELAAQMPILKDVLDAMNIERRELAGWEADDLMGTIAARCGERGWNTVVVTGDRDSFQLIGEHTAIKYVKTRGGETETKLYDTAAFEEEYGFEPIHIIDLKALMGDASDNIPGVKGVGEKTAMGLIQRYGSIDRVYDALPELCSASGTPAKPGIVRKLREGREQAYMSLDLATIRLNAPLDFEPEQALVKEPDNDRLYTLFQRLGFRKFIEACNLTPPRGVTSITPEAYEVECTIVEVDTEAELEDFEAALSGGEVGVSITPGCSVTAAVPAAGNTTYLVRNTSPVYRRAMEALSAASVLKVGHNVKDIQRELLKRGFSMDGWSFDVALAAYLLEPTASSYETDRLTVKYCGFTIGEGADAEQLSLLTDDIQSQARVCGEAAAMLCIKEAQKPKLAEAGLERVFYEIEMPLCPVLARMETAGFLVDRQALCKFGELLSKQIEELEGRIYELTGTTFNINSPKQLGEILFDKLLLPAPKKTKTGYSTSAEVLEKLRPMHPVIGQVLEYRELTKLKSTYADGLQKVIAEDGRIHTSFQMTVTATGRLSSVEPNLQNIPIRRELGGEIRKMFVASPGNCLVDADYSQIELRILAHISGDETMRDAFLNGEDIHRITAAQVLGVPPEEVTARQRSQAKAVNFGIVYGISAFSLSEDIGVSVQEAKEYINTYMARYHGVRDYMERVVREGKETGRAVTLYGRLRPLPELHASNFTQRSFGERVARNMPIQGTAADIMKLAMVRVQRAIDASGLNARLLLQVHDELIAECPEGEAEEVKALLIREMEGAANLTVPLTVDAKVGKTWYEAH